MRARLVTLLALASCSRVCSEPTPTVDAAPDVAAEAVAKASRCTEEGPLLRIAAEDQPVEIGGAALGGTQAAIGLTVGGRSKVVFYREGASRSADLGPPDPSSPPPVAITDGTDVLVARGVRIESARSIVIDRITESAGPRPFASIPIGNGDDLDFDAAVEDGVGPLGGAEVIAVDHLVVSGTADEDEQVWANEPSLDGLFEAPAAATYARRGCIPVTEALGPDATAEDLQKVEQAHPLSILDDLPAFTVAFGDHLATVRTEPNRNDLFSRLDVGRDWPDPEFGAAFRNAVADPTTGRIGYEIPRPPDAAALALLEELPFAICNDAVPIPEPTGL